MPKKILVLGGGGHASVLIEALNRQNDVYHIIGILDERPEHVTATRSFPCPVLGGDDSLQEFAPDSVLLVNGVGSVGIVAPRRQLFERCCRLGYTFESVIHPGAILAHDIRMGHGVQIMAGAVVQTGTVIDDNVIINTRASVDHDCRIGAHTHIAPGAILCGHVQIGHAVHIGAGAIIVQGIRIGSRSIVGAGAVVLQHVEEESRVVGVPARQLH
jgi:sugar O-acyltransferase (sialic acid O-acetyltransferase NeuD family)